MYMSGDMPSPRLNQILHEGAPEFIDGITQQMNEGKPKYREGWYSAPPPDARPQKEKDAWRKELHRRHVERVKKIPIRVENIDQEYAAIQSGNRKRNHHPSTNASPPRRTQHAAPVQSQRKPHHHGPIVKCFENHDLISIANPPRKNKKRLIFCDVCGRDPDELVGCHACEWDACKDCLAKLANDSGAYLRAEAKYR